MNETRKQISLAMAGLRGQLLFCLGIALTGMLEDSEISRQRAGELARMVLRGNAQALYKF